MPIKPVNRPSVNEEVFMQMQNLILKGEWPPGSRIPSETELKEMFSVSRHSIREVLQKLSILGIVKSKRGSGTYVAEESTGLYMNSLLPVFLLEKPNMLQILEFRKAIEVESVELAVKKSDAEKIDVLNKILAEMEKTIEDTERFGKLDFCFHSEIARMTCNPLIVKVNLLLREVMELGFVEQTKVLGSISGFIEHKEIFEAIKNKDCQLARELMGEHIDKTRERIMKSEMDVGL